MMDKNKRGGQITTTFHGGFEYGPEKIIPLDSGHYKIVDPNQWGIHNLHPLSFGAGFLLSSLFWLIIGIAIGVLS